MSYVDSPTGLQGLRKRPLPATQRSRKRQDRLWGRFLRLTVLAVMFAVGVGCLASEFGRTSVPVLQAHRVTDTTHTLTADEHTTLAQTIARLDDWLDATTYVVVSNPLTSIPTQPLPNRGIWLAFNPQSGQALIKVGPGLRQPPGVWPVLGSSVQPVLNTQMQVRSLPSSGRVLSFASTLQTLLVRVTQVLAPQATHSMVQVP
jgi:hypothetical protein